MQINLLEIWHSMGLPVRCVVLLLTCQAIACVAVVIDRALVLYKSSQKARAFVMTAQPALEAGAYDRVLADAAAFQSIHLASYLELGLRIFVTRMAAGDGPERAVELARRALERKGDAVSRDLNRGMNILASTGSTAPFVGLLGTVLGIINAFKMIAATGSGGIGTIGAAIGEALVVTGYGLMVAIPSVLLFNLLSARIASYEAGMLNAGSELMDRLELSQPSLPAVQPALPQVAVAQPAVAAPVASAPVAPAYAAPAAAPASAPVSARPPMPSTARAPISGAPAAGPQATNSSGPPVRRPTPPLRAPR